MPLVSDQLIAAAFDAALLHVLQAAVRGAILVLGILIGKKLAIDFYKPPSNIKIILISMPIGIVIASVFALYSYKLVTDPGETELIAVYNAIHTFFLVLIPLLVGCGWGLLILNRDP